MSDITVSVTGGSGVTVDVTGSTAAADVTVSGATASVTVTQMGGDRGPQGDVGPAGPAGSSGANGTFSDAQEINARTESYTLVLSDAGKLIAANHTSTAITITVPAGSTAAFPVGTHIDIARLGTAAVTVAGASGVTVNGTPGLKLRAQYSAATLIEVSSDSWLLVGDLSA